MNFWDNKFNSNEYIYGTDANEFLKETLKKLPLGKILFICEGEGRNSVYAAKLGFQVYAFDSSIIGKEKALKLAKKSNVNIDYKIADANEVEYIEDSFDYIVCIFAHFTKYIRENIHNKLTKWLKVDGKIFLEAFNPNQIGLNSGGPKDIEMLYNKALIKNDFKSLQIDLLEEIKVNLNEGNLHQGEAEVIRFIGTKT